MNEQQSQQALQAWETHVGGLLENAQQQVEQYTHWIRELVADAREDGG